MLMIHTTTAKITSAISKAMSTDQMVRAFASARKAG